MIVTVLSYADEQHALPIAAYTDRAAALAELQRLEDAEEGETVYRVADVELIGDLPE